MAKKNPAADVDDLLGKPAAKGKPATKKAEAAPAKKTAAPAAKKAAAPAEKPKKEPVHFAEGERQKLYDAVTAHFKKSKKAINSKELAEKLGVPTRKLRRVLYSLAKRAEPVVALELAGSKAGGMTVTPA